MLTFNDIILAGNRYLLLEIGNAVYAVRPNVIRQKFRYENVRLNGLIGGERHEATR